MAESPKVADAVDKQESVSPKKTAAAGASGPKFQRNEMGGILITKDDLRIVWDFFEQSRAGVSDEQKHTNKLTVNDIKKLLGTFYKNVNKSELAFLLNNKNEITFDELYDLLKENQLKQFDPVKDAFKIYDPDDTGFVDLSLVQDFFKTLGFGEISDADAKLIQEMADSDCDGKIGLDDFRKLVPFGKPE